MMALHRSNSKIALPVGWLFAALAVTALLWVCLASGRSTQDARPAEQVRVVQGPNLTAGPPPIIPLSSPVDSSAPPQAAIADITREYPMLTNPAIDCTEDPCALTALIVPVEGQAALDKRQEMLLGGLQAHLAARGYRMAVPFQVDEIDDNTFRLRAKVSPLR